MAKAAKKKGPASGVQEAHTIDVEHEVIETTTATNKENGGAILVDDQTRIKMEIAKLNVADAGIAVLKEKYGTLVIADASDKKGYEAVKKAWNEVRSTRTALEKKGLEIRNQFKVITTAVKAEEERLIESLDPLETDLYKKWKAIDDEKERAKKEQEEAEQKQLMARVEEVQTLGMAFKDGFYQIGDTIAVDVASLRMYNDEQYAKLKGAIDAKKKELDKIAADAAEKLRLENEQRQKEQDDLKRQQDDLKKQQDQLREQQEQLKRDQDAAAKIKRDNRINKLVALGMTYNERTDLFVHDNGFRTTTHGGADLFSLDDYGFDEHAKIIAGHITDNIADKAKHDQEVEAERQALENHKKFIAATMDRAGLNFSYTAQSFTWEDKNTAIEVTFAELIPLTEPEVSEKAQAIQAQIEEAKKATAAADKKAKDAADKEAKLALGDKERYQQEHSAIGAAALKMVPGEFKTKKYQQRAQNFLDRLSNLLMEFQ